MISYRLRSIPADHEFRITTGRFAFRGK